MSRISSPADVRDHRFGAGPPFTVGVEEEYMLLDPETFDLVPRAEEILQAEAGGEFAEHISPELFESLVEFHTPVCADVAGGGPRSCAGCGGTRSRRCAAQGLRLGSAGTHPFSLFERQRIMRRDRYQLLIDAAPVRRPPRADLRAARARRRRRPRPRDPDRQRAARAPVRARRAVGQLALLARPADRLRLLPAPDLLRLPALRPAAALRLLRRVRERRSSSWSRRAHRGLHADLVGRAPAPALRDGRGPRDGRGHRASRTRSRWPPTSRRSSRRYDARTPIAPHATR